MPTLGLVDTPDDASAAATVKATSQSTIKSAQTKDTANIEDQAFNDAARLWPKEGHQDARRFKTAVCRCLSFGFSQAEIAHHIRRVAYSQPLEARKDFLYMSIHHSVQEINTDMRKELEVKKESKMEQTSQSVEYLLSTMGKLDLNKENGKHASKNTSTSPKTVYDDRLVVPPKPPKEPRVVDKPKLEKEEEGDDDDDEEPRLTKEDIKKKVSKMKREVLDISHRHSGALVRPISPEASAAARHRVKMIIEQPKQFHEYVLMGLRQDIDMSALDMIQLIDYYAS